MSEKGHFVASADVVEEKAPAPLPPPLTRVYENSEPSVQFDAVEIEAVELDAANSDELELDAPEAPDEQIKCNTDIECTTEVGSATAPGRLSHDDHLRNIMESFQRAVTPPVVDVAQLLPRFDGPQLKFPVPESGS